MTSLVHSLLQLAAVFIVMFVLVIIKTQTVHSTVVFLYMTTIMDPVQLPLRIHHAIGETSIHHTYDFLVMLVLMKPIMKVYGLQHVIIWWFTSGIYWYC